jgi:hypothetical protein
MFNTTCPDCGHTWWSPLGWFLAVSCPNCRRRHSPWKVWSGPGGTPAVRKNQAAAGGEGKRVRETLGQGRERPASRLAFAALVVALALLGWLVVARLVAFWQWWMEQVERGAGPP